MLEANAVLGRRSWRKGRKPKRLPRVVRTGEGFQVGRPACSLAGSEDAEKLRILIWKGSSREKVG